MACNAGGSGSSSGPGGNQQPPAQTSAPTPTLATGTITLFPAKTDNSEITTGPDHNLWFGGVDNYGNQAIIRMTTTGTVTAFKLPPNIVSIIGITAGPDGNLWFTPYGGNNHIGPDLRLLTSAAK